MVGSLCTCKDLLFKTIACKKEKTVLHDCQQTVREMRQVVQNARHGGLGWTRKHLGHVDTRLIVQRSWAGVFQGLPLALICILFELLDLCLCAQIICLARSEH